MEVGQGTSIASRHQINTAFIDKIYTFLHDGDAFFNGKEGLLRIVQYSLSAVKSENAGRISSAIGLGRMSGHFCVLVDGARQFLLEAEEDVVLWWHHQVKCIGDIISFVFEHAYWFCEICPSIGNIRLSNSIISRLDGQATLTDRFSRWSSWPWFTFAILEVTETLYTAFKKDKDCLSPKSGIANKGYMLEVIAGVAETLVALHFCLLREGRRPLLSKRLLGLLGIVYPFVKARRRWERLSADAETPKNAKLCSCN
eukprot:TRINITY_DN64897_c0_g1_i1.p1 TRINITY_DN64897_c0_g1~~TRINITY_DN64897_c0_g1_i1.p1  ORF type:complete len:256 (+),score=28.09 TRINITY_DN64897_c0_g1_i1:66-833(+)